MAKSQLQLNEKKFTSYLDVPILSPYAGLYLDPGTADIPVGGWPVHNHFHYYKDRIMPYPGWKRFSLSGMIENLCPCGGGFLPIDAVLSFMPISGANSYTIQIFQGVSCDGDPIFEETLTP